MESYDEIRQKYTDAAKQHAVSWGEDVSKHIIDIIVSVMMTRDNVLKGGDFVQSICKNDLMSAVCRADDECIKYLKLITLAYYNAFVNDKN